MHTITELISETLTAHEVAGIGFGVCGLVKDGSIDGIPPNLNGWTNTPISQIVSEVYDGSIIVEQDGICAVRAEAAQSTHKERIYLLTIGTGVGGAFIDSSINPWYVIPAEPGHMIIDMRTRDHVGLTPGSLTEYVAGGKASSRYGRAFEEMHADAAEWELIAYALACGISTIATLFRPDRIVLSGGVIEKQKHHLPEKIMHSFTDTLRIFDADEYPISVSNVASDEIVGRGLLTLF